LPNKRHLFIAFGQALLVFTNSRIWLSNIDIAERSEIHTKTNKNRLILKNARISWSAFNWVLMMIIQL